MCALGGNRQQAACALAALLSAPYARSTTRSKHQHKHRTCTCHRCCRSHRCKHLKHIKHAPRQPQAPQKARLAQAHEGGRGREREGEGRRQGKTQDLVVRATAEGLGKGHAVPTARSRCPAPSSSLRTASSVAPATSSVTSLSIVASALRAPSLVECRETLRLFTGARHGARKQSTSESLYGLSLETPARAPPAPSPCASPTGSRTRIYVHSRRRL